MNGAIFLIQSDGQLIEMREPCDEDSSDRWSLDHLFLDQDGIPTLIEVKRSTDTRTRREVVARMLDYAANAVVNWSVDRIRGEFERTCQQRKVDPANEFEAFLERAGQPGTGDHFWQDVKTNLQGPGRCPLLPAGRPPRLSVPRRPRVAGRRTDNAGLSRL
jgi:hypothetical protein